MLCLTFTLVKQLILSEHRLILQAHMFGFEIKLLMAKYIPCAWFHKLMMAGTIMFSRYWWLFFFAQGTGLSLRFTAVVHALHLEKEKGVERGKIFVFWCFSWVRLSSYLFQYTWISMHIPSVNWEIFMFGHHQRSYDFHFYIQKIYKLCSYHWNL